MNEPEVEYQDIIAIEDGEYTYEYIPSIDSLFILYSVQEEEAEDYYICIYSDGIWSLDECPEKDYEKLKKYLSLMKGLQE